MCDTVADSRAAVMDTLAHTGRCWILLIVCVLHSVAGADQCHCTSPGACDKYPEGTCSACEKFWSGPNCQIFNAAEGATRSTRRQPSGSDSGIPVAGTYSNSRCTYISDASGTAAVWTVVLNNTFDISKLTIYHHRDHAASLRNLKVYIDLLPCKSVSTPNDPPTPFTIRCDKPVKGDTVSIVLPLSQTEINTLALCRVVIEVCGDYWFGEQCSSRCNCINTNEVCDKTDGSCISGQRSTTTTLRPSSDTSTTSTASTTKSTKTTTTTTAKGGPTSADGGGTTKTMAAITVPGGGSQDRSQEPAVSLGAIAGVVCGVLLGFAVVVVAVVLLVLKLRKRKPVTAPAKEKSGNAPQMTKPPPSAMPSDSSPYATTASITNSSEHVYLGVSNTDDTAGPVYHSVEPEYAEIIDSDYLQPVHSPNSNV
ncbi:uncharacterized protein LOC124113495 isoform X2 [Haliotis rufescens]|uniref:uncharacterized protein LOC124113495 isoform X2 n=1 Tax=Haliotis rufescens TaxID=6454 RepID=UPI00201F02DC|nr:uncharacterized protein LOC124113495 isoform X2 [Haliotis rufescens]